jgi:hypothetical protein
MTAAVFVFEGGLQRVVLRCLGHLGQRCENLLLGEIDVLERVDEEVVESLFGHE